MTAKTLEAFTRINLRERRSAVFAHEIMNIVRKHAPDADMAALYDDLMERFVSAGAEVITDADRKVAGLSPRDGYGYTPEELVALENYRLELLTRPLFVTIPKA